MKKHLLSLFLMIFSFIAVFSQENYEKNLISRDVFSTSDVNEISVNLFQESCTLKIAKANSIYVEIFSNNLKKKPDVILDSNDGILQIEKTNLSYNKGDFCSVVIYIPQSFLDVTYSLTTKYGNLTLEDINSNNSIVIDNGEGSTKILNCNCDYLFFLNSGKTSSILFENLSCSYFDITAADSDITISLTKAPDATSKITARNGQINITIPKSENFDLNVRSNNSKFINNYTKITQTARTNRIFQNGTDGAPVFLQTFNGDITLNF